MTRIPISGPWITQREIDYVADAAAHAWYSDAGVFHERFEAALAQYVGVKHAVALPSCTSAIHLALMALDIGPGDEVIVPELTWIATAAPITYLGAKPVFADVDPLTWCISPESFEQCISPHTKAVIPVDLYGGMAPYDRIGTIASHYGVTVIEDAAEAIGSELDGVRAGAHGKMGVFSFHGSKTLTTGEGGALLTNDDAMLARVLALRDHGRNPGDRAFFNVEVAHKYKMSAMQAAMGLAQLERIEELVARKRWVFAQYEQALGKCPDLQLNVQPAGVFNTYWMVTALISPFRGIDKVALGERLGQLGIDTRPMFYPLSSLPAFAHFSDVARAKAHNEVAYRVSPYGLNLPSAPTLSEADIDRVCSALLECLDHSSLRAAS